MILKSPCGALTRQVCQLSPSALRGFTEVVFPEPRSTRVNDKPGLSKSPATLNSRNGNLLLDTRWLSNRPAFALPLLVYEPQETSPGILGFAWSEPLFTNPVTLLGTTFNGSRTHAGRILRTQGLRR